MAAQFTLGNNAINCVFPYPTANAPMQSPMYVNNNGGAYHFGHPTPPIYVYANPAPPAHQGIDHTRRFAIVTEKMREQQLANAANNMKPKAVSRYKTEICRSFHETGQCKYGLTCLFAHGFDDMRIMQRHPKYKTELCRVFHTVGVCPFGVRCYFVHNVAERAAVRRMQERMIYNYEMHTKLSNGPVPEVFYGSPVILVPQCPRYESQPNMGMGDASNLSNDFSHELQTAELDGAPQGLMVDYPH